jgi:hypothetical protein
MANVLWHNSHPKGEEATHAQNLEALGALSVKNPHGAQLKGPFTLNIKHNEAKGYAIHITAQGAPEPLIFNIERAILETSDITNVANYYLARKHSSYTPDPAIDICEVRTLFCRNLGAKIQETIAPRVTDTGSTAHYLASRILDMELSARSRVNDSPSERSRV